MIEAKITARREGVKLRKSQVYEAWIIVANPLPGRENRLAVEEVQSLVGGDEVGTEARKLRDHLLAVFLLQGFNRISSHRNSALTLQQSFCGEGHTIFRNHPEDDEVCGSWKELEQGIDMPGLENIEGLLFEKDLLILKQVGRQSRRGLVGKPTNFVGEGLGNVFGSFASFHAMRRKSLELWIIRSMKASVRDEKDAIIASGLGQLSDIGQQFFGSGNIELTSRQHEVFLRIDFPENDVAGKHSVTQGA